MASNEHQQLAQFLKDVHLSLRKRTACVGEDAAWEDHCKNKDVLSKYSQYMEKLATTYWNNNLSDENGITSRIKWAADFSYDYFINKSLEKYREKEIEIGNKINLSLHSSDIFLKPINLLDVGSCYNPFKVYEFLEVLAIDLCPANEDVLQCDFLKVPTAHTTTNRNNHVEQIQEDSFDVITFCFLLEYLPNSKLRIKACEKAYKLLKSEGLLIISTPDSKHVGANSKIMKCWRYTMACMGFSRIKYEKFQHMHCMAFRKSLHIKVASRWADIHKEPYMEFEIHIPQDFTIEKDEPVPEERQTEISSEDMEEPPFHEKS